MKTTKKRPDRKSAEPTRAQLAEQLANLRRKIWLQQSAWKGQAADLELRNACGVKEVFYSPRDREVKGATLRNCATIDLAYVMQGEG